MARRFFQVQDEVAFTASTSDLPIPFNPYLDTLDLSLRFTTAVAAVLTKTGLQTVKPLEIKLNNTAVTSLQGDDAFALANEFLGEAPLVGETTGVGSTGKIEGIPIPVWGQPKHGSWSTRASFASQTNVSAPVVSLEAEIVDKVLHEGYISALTSFFTPPSSGSGFNQAYDNLLPADCLGILFFSTTVPTFAADTISCREVQALIAGTLAWQAEWKNISRPGSGGTLKNPPVVGTVFAQGFTDFLQNYAYYDTHDDPIPKGQRLTLKIQSDDTSTIRIIPVLQFK